MSDNHEFNLVAVDKVQDRDNPGGKKNFYTNLGHGTQHTRKQSKAKYISIDVLPSVSVTSSTLFVSKHGKPTVNLGDYDDKCEIYVTSPNGERHRVGTAFKFSGGFDIKPANGTALHGTFFIQNRQ